jgi:hypothetical protein
MKLGLFFRANMSDCSSLAIRNVASTSLVARVSPLLGAELPPEQEDDKLDKSAIGSPMSAMGISNILQ